MIVLTIRALGLLVTWVMCAANHRPFDFQAWDGYFYLGMADYGYGGFDPSVTYDLQGEYFPYAPMAFFPGYPLVVRLLGLPFGGHLLAVALTVSLAASIAAGYGVARLAQHAGAGRRGQLAAVALTAGAPMSVVYSLPYPEALLVALAAWTLVAILEQRWILAGLGAAAAGLTSPMAGPLIPVVMAAGLVHLFRARTHRIAAAVAVVVAPLGMLGYLLWVSLASGVPGGYFGITERGWGNRVDFGVTTARWVLDMLTTSREVFPVLTAVVIVAVVIATVRTRMPWPVWLYTAGSVALVVAHSGIIHDRVRLLLSAFPLLIVAAIRLSRRRGRTTAFVVGGVVLAGLWFGAYSLAVWPSSI
ncbi:hypothetical protein FNH05_02610 [Amycolatopsis rhizosphaerae]|uniref:DUF2029 domain-containing protein n=1 Tax=Amycolatopsis rhizosphaerae TaxID=2053003 RepID=A0A558DKN4_9PSEU|nr:hypothetical protein [Amycolatopsis rhizosphaerae]TVT61578.1 hypothetical protein FNH05_02610 [Amycolatopsis rhizosphaerae]